jgi:hypothetical protein
VEVAGGGVLGGGQGGAAAAATVCRRVGPDAEGWGGWRALVGVGKSGGRFGWARSRPEPQLAVAADQGAGGRLCAAGRGEARRGQGAGCLYRPRGGARLGPKDRRTLGAPRERTDGDSGQTAGRTASRTAARCPRVWQGGVSSACVYLGTARCIGKTRGWRTDRGTAEGGARRHGAGAHAARRARESA